MAAAAAGHDGRYLVPSRLTRRRDVADDTTAGLFSAMIAQQYTAPDQLYSANERNGYVWPDEDYNFASYDPSRDTWWDTSFTADLDKRAIVRLGRRAIQKSE